MHLKNRSGMGVVIICTLILHVGASAQTTQPTSRPAADDNPPAEGFDLEGSDARAIAIADAVMEKMGGRKAWDDTRYIAWKFFGFRMHYWDKHTGDIRVEFEREGVRTVVLANLNTKKGTAWIDGKEITDKEELSGMMDRAKSWWINDAYWLVMPYKLKDSGVTLKYAGEKDMENGRAADVLVLTFDSVGNTPENKYEVFVAKDSGLVEQWAYFRTAADEEAGMTTPWQNWERHGSILLSADRGMRQGRPSRHTDVGVFKTLPESVFTDPGPVDFPISE